MLLYIVIYLSLMMLLGLKREYFVSMQWNGNTSSDKWIMQWMLLEINSSSRIVAIWHWQKWHTFKHSDKKLCVKHVLNRIPSNCPCNGNWRPPSSMELHGIFFYLMEPLASSIPWVLNWDRIPWNLSFVSLCHQLMFYYQYLHYTICISGITHYVSKYHLKFL